MKDLSACLSEAKP